MEESEKDMIRFSERLENFIKAQENIIKFQDEIFNKIDELSKDLMRTQSSFENCSSTSGINREYLQEKVRSLHDALSKAKIDLEEIQRNYVIKKDFGDLKVDYESHKHEIQGSLKTLKIIGAIITFVLATILAIFKLVGR